MGYDYWKHDRVKLRVGLPDEDVERIGDGSGTLPAPTSLRSTRRCVSTSPLSATTPGAAPHAPIDIGHRRPDPLGHRR